MKKTITTKRYLLGVLAMCLGSMAIFAQTGNHVFEGAEAVNFAVIDLATPGGQTWSTFRGATPGYFSAVGTASYSGAADAANVNGYVKHYANAANQGFTFPVGTGTDLRVLSVSGTRTASAVLGVAWIVGNPTGALDPTGPNSGAHNVANFGTGITAVSPVGQWDWQDISGNSASTVTVSIPNMSAFAVASNLRLVGWNGSQWVNLSGTTGASGNTEDNTLSGTMIAGITALGIGKGDAFTDFGDNSAFSAVAATYTDANNDGTPDGTGSVWLGTSVSADLADASNATATGDASGDDGFGLPPTTGGTIDHTVTLSAAGATTAFYSVRIVYSGTNGGAASSGTIDLTGSHTFTAAGSQTITLSPAALDGFVGTINYRVVAASSAAAAAAAITGTNFTNGEVEDYQRIYTNPLPVELLDFTANWQGDDALVEWTTATEINNSHFNVERSFDGVSFEYVATVASEAVGGNSNELIDYTYQDKGIKNKTAEFVYYRLVQTDFDGASEVHGPATLKVQRSSKPSISLYPVPAHNEVTVQVNTPANSSNYALQVIDAIGVVVAEYTVDAARETTATKLDISNLPSGAYWIQVVGDNVSLNTQKFIKINE